jgi:radical SAM superfamily enzyme YgiQ (UPF0313 family)
MPRALLINPWIEDFAAYDFWARPLGLLCLASSLRAAGYEVSFLDLVDVRYAGRSAPLPKRKADGSGKFDSRAIPNPPALSSVTHRKFHRYGMPALVLRKMLRSLERPDVILVNSVMTYWYTGAAATISELKKAWPESPVVLGGVYATLLPDHALDHTGADLVAAGDFRAFLPPILKGLKLPFELPQDLPFPAWDLYPELSGAAVITGRGCPYRCPYCSVHVLHPRLLRRDPGEVLDELEKLSTDFGARDVAVLDDAIRAGGDGHLTALLEGVIGRDLAFKFHAINALHLKMFTPELAWLLRRAGFATLRFGLETADPALAKKLGGKAFLDDLHQAVSCLAAAGYEPRKIGVYLLAGLPGQKPLEIESGIKEVIRAGAQPFLSEYSPVPGSPMWGEAVAASRFDIEREPLFHNNSLLPCAHPELDYLELDRLKKQARGPFRTAR